MIPLFLMAIVGILFVLSKYRKLPDYLFWYTIGIIASILFQIIQTVIFPKDLYSWTLISSTLFFISMACMTHAVYLRLSIATHHARVIGYILFADSILAYFCFINPNLDARIIITTTTTVFIILNHPMAFLKAKPSFYLDIFLKYVTVAILVCVLLRGMFLLTQFNQSSWLEHQEEIWASTQFIILVFIILQGTIFISTTISDRINSLSYERNLDPLTYTLNRRALEEQLPRYYDKKLKYQNAILMCDLDYFKKINDTYGHDAGDQTLKHVTHIIKKFLGNDDLLARIGGEEFQIILHNVSPENALLLAEKLRIHIELSPLNYHQHTIHITMSIGLSFFEDADSYAKATQHADELLYLAKKTGRNNTQS